MKKQIIARWVVITGLVLTAALLVLVSDNFSADAIVTVATTVGLGSITALGITWYVLRNEKMPK